MDGLKLEGLKLEVGLKLGVNRAIMDEGIQDEEQWTQNVGGYMQGFPKPGSTSEADPILIQLKQWCDKKWVSVVQFKTMSDPCP